MDTITADDFTPVLPTQAELAALRAVAFAAELVVLRHYGSDVKVGKRMDELLAAVDALAALLADAGDSEDASGDAS